MNKIPKMDYTGITYTAKFIKKHFVSKQELIKKIDEEIERWEKVGDEKASYKISALYDLRKLIK